MQFIFGDKSEVYFLDESALPVSKIESVREGGKDGALDNQTQIYHSDTRLVRYSDGNCN